MIHGFDMENKQIFSSSLRSSAMVICSSFFGLFSGWELIIIQGLEDFQDNVSGLI